MNPTVLIFGSSGRVGSRLVQYSLEQNFYVKAFTRSKERIFSSHQNLEIIEGDVFHSEEVIQSCSGVDYIFSALSGRSTKPDYSVLSIGISNILKGMEKWNVSRILNVAGAGILKDPQYGLRRDRPGYPAIFRNVSAENLKVLSLLENAKVNWTCICAPEMPEGNRTGNYRTEIDLLPENGSRISVEDVADFILKNIENPLFYKKKIGIAY